MRLEQVLARPGETLTAHTREVVERVAQLARLRPMPEHPRLYHRLYWAALLHDSGKLAGGFQRGLRSRKARWGLRHEVLSLAFVDTFAFDLDDRGWISAAIATHHRDATWILNHYLYMPGGAPVDEADNPVTQLIADLDDGLARAWYDWLGTVHQAWATELGLNTVVDSPAIRPFQAPNAESVRAALRTLSEWTGKDALYAILLRGGILLADHAGSARTRAFARPTIVPERIYEAIGPRLFGHQKALTPDPSPSGEGRGEMEQSLLLIAPTGSGKTEAALLWATGQQPGPTRVFYVLPYRASIDAMAERLGRYFPRSEIGVQHGRALQSLYRRALRSPGHEQSRSALEDKSIRLPSQPPEGGNEPDESPPEGSAGASRWVLTPGEGRRSEMEAAAEAQAALNISRLRAYPVQVFSPYHLLRAMYQFKGFESTLADCYGSRMIIDEIHAYDPERLALIIGALQMLRQAFAVRLLIMTATLPPILAEELDNALPGLVTVKADAETFARFQRHIVHIEPGDLTGALLAIQAEAAAGRAVLVVVNTVRRARQVAAALEQRGCDVLALHGRFNGHDRWRHEQQLMGLFGTRARPNLTPRPPLHFVERGSHTTILSGTPLSISWRGDGGEGLGAGGEVQLRRLPIVVSTQVIEVSLDLDFDTLYTDPAPLEALLQRFGRVNRGRSTLALEVVHVFEQPTGIDDRRPVYDPLLVQASLDVLRSADGQPVDEARFGEWLAQVYAGERADAWRERYRRRLAEFRRTVLDDWRPFDSADDGLVQQFVLLFDGLDALPLDLEAEYDALREQNPIAASELLVPLAYWQYKMLEGWGRAWPAEGDNAMRLYYTDMPYTAAFGLQLEDDTEE